MSTNDCDLLILGGGPAGLSAAINGASEGLKVCLLDATTVLGGQARESSAIENYPLPVGFPNGVTGEGLMNGFVDQAHKFNTDLHLPSKAVRLEVDGDRKIVITEEYEEYAARVVILSLGVSYRRLQAKGLSKFMGRGVFYGLPPSTASLSGKTVGVIGGANSAGQAVLKLARNPRCNVVMFVRRTLEDAMSSYLIERIRTCPNVTVMEGVEVTAVVGDDRMAGVTYTSNGVPSGVSLSHLFVFIGAVPKTAWLGPCKIELDDKRFIMTDVDLAQSEGKRLPYETSVRGVFAAGDVRSGSIKRIASAIGEGAGALQMCHRYLGEEA